MKILLILTAVLLFLFQPSKIFAVVITGFGSTGESGASAFSIDTNTTSFSTTSQTASNLRVTGNDGQQILAGSFSGINISGMAGIQLTAMVAGTNPGSSFSVDLYNSDFSLFRTYSANLASFGSGSFRTILLNYVSGSTSFNTIGGFQYTGGGEGSSVDLTFDTLSAVPEPSTYMLAGLGAVGMVIVSRHKLVRNNA